MKILLLILFACLLMTACTKSAQQNQQREQTEQVVEGTVSQGEALLNILNADDRSLVVLNNDSLSYHTARGVQDLMQILSEDPDRLKGATVADKVVGRGAASLLIAAGVSEVHTNVVSTPARQMLEEAGIRVFALEEVPQILNRDRSGQCPIEAMLNDADSPEECLKLLQAKFAE